ncbi:potassium voltage-gated channel protein Shaw-like [Babylonia areolata]|uniref:potassium voltage-gated channel protein Shaw-like n=1 Tax=Babylonia areolata TaxID=304850 RepID=UPI003FD6B6CC
MATKPVDAPAEPQANTGRMSRGQLSPDRPQQDSANKAQQKAERKRTDQVPEPSLSSKVNPPDHFSIILDVGGKKFRTTRATLMKLPNTRLGRLVQEKGQLRKNSGMVEFFFDRNPKMMNSVLDLYRKGELHLPSSMCYSLVEEELEFWEIPVELMSACCWKKFKQHQNLTDAMAEMHKLFQTSFPEAVVKGATSWRLRLWNMLQLSFDSLASKATVQQYPLTYFSQLFSGHIQIWSFIFYIFVFMSIFNFIFETDPYFRVPTDKFRRYLDAHNTTLTETRNEARNWLEMVIFTKAILHFGMETLVYSKETEEVSHGEKSVTLILYALSAVRVLRILYLGNVFPDLKRRQETGKYRC